jgi:predicted ATPase
MTSTNDKSSMPELQWATVNETLYERQEQKELLLRAVQKCCRSSSASSRHPELCLLSGGSGTGKTSLAIKHLAPYVQKDLGGFFLRGKFGRLESSEKYNAVVSAFSGFFSAAKQGRLPAWPSLEPKVRECLKNEPFLTELIPELEDYGEVAVNASSPSGGAVRISTQGTSSRSTRAFLSAFVANHLLSTTPYRVIPRRYTVDRQLAA